MNKGKIQLKAVIFDFDGVLCSDYFYHTLEQVDSNLYNQINKKIFQGDKELIRSWMRGAIDYSDINNEISKRLNTDEDFLHEHLIKSIKNMTLNNLLLDFAKGVKSKGIKTAIMTDNMDVFEKYLVPHFKLNNHFDLIYSSSTHKRLKKDNNWQTPAEVMSLLNSNLNNSLFIDDWEEICDYIQSQNGYSYLYQRGNNESDFADFHTWFRNIFEV